MLDSYQSLKDLLTNKKETARPIADQMDYLNAFQSAHGLNVLTDMLVKNFFFDETQNEAETIARNQFISMLKEMGVITGNQEHLKDFVKGILVMARARK